MKRAIRTEVENHCSVTGCDSNTARVPSKARGMAAGSNALQPHLPSETLLLSWVTHSMALLTHRALSRRASDASQANASTCRVPRDSREKRVSVVISWLAASQTRGPCRLKSCVRTLGRLLRLLLAYSHHQLAAQGGCISPFVWCKRWIKLVQHSCRRGTHSSPVGSHVWILHQGHRHC